jgi:hypothetical protein
MLPILIIFFVLTGIFFLGGIAQLLLQKKSRRKTRPSKSNIKALLSGPRSPEPSNYNYN